MNALPEKWNALRAEAGADAAAYVLVDGAMQRALSIRLGDLPLARPLLDTDSAEGRQLGPWLVSEASAASVGIVGVPPGVNWLLSTQALEALAHHLSRHFVLPPDDRGSQRSYLRVADGRIFGHLLSIWTPAQRSAFFAPLIAWCASDRDGAPALHACSERPPDNPDRPTQNRAPTLSAAQRDALFDACVPDMLLAHLDAFASDGNNEARHRLAVRTIGAARHLGYEGSGEQAEILATALARDCADGLEATLDRLLSDQPRGAELTARLDAWVKARPAGAAPLSRDQRTEHTSSP